jgi:hypothetical protein
MLLLSARIAVLCLLALAPFTAQAAMRRHVDKRAGISYPLPNAEASAKSQKELAKLNSAQAARSARISYTSGHSLTKQRMPYILVWTMPLESQLTRATIDSLKDGELVFRLLGIKDWRFDAKRLLGGGIGQRVGAIRSELVLQVLKNRYAYVGFFYELDEQLKDWKKIKAGIEPIATQKVNYQALPSSAGGSILASAGKSALIGGLVGGIGFLAWLLINRQKKGGDGGGSAGGASSSDSSPELAA